MNATTPLTASPRLLVIDDNRAIHNDFRNILNAGSDTTHLDALEAELFGETAVPAIRPNFEIDSAYQGQEGLEQVERALAEGRPYSVAFVDIQMPPGWDGIETIERLWHADPALQAVICTAYSDYQWADIVARLPRSDQFLILKKPFDPIEVIQMAHALSTKWRMQRELQAHWQQRKLEAIGQLAAGIAHEINTPIQYISNNVDFLKTAFDDLQSLLDCYRESGAALALQPEQAGLIAAIQKAEQSADLEYLRENVPNAFADTLEGIEHVTGIVRAMKEFAHPDQREKTPGDLNKALRNTLVIAHNAYKYSFANNYLYIVNEPTHELNI